MSEPAGEYMLSFSEINLENAQLLRKYFMHQPFRTCDYTIGAVFEWRVYMKSLFALDSGMLIMSADYPGEQRCYMYPVGNGELTGALQSVEAHARMCGHGLTYCAVPEEGVRELRARYGDRCVIKDHRDWADYLYNLRDLIDFPGKPFHTQRNHFNRFKRENPSHRLVPITKENLPSALAFLDEYALRAPADKPIEAEEMLRARELLTVFDKLGQKAAYIEVNGVVVALAVGEVVGDTLYVHVEKARTDYAGAYQAIVSMFADFAAEDGTRYINREDDSGEEGLRYSKMAYRPIRLVDKYWVSVNKEG